MDPISSTAPMQISNTQSSDPMMEKAKSMGVPDEVIAKGKSAIKAWAKENGKIPGGEQQDSSGSGPQRAESGGTLSEELGKSQINHDELLTALDGGAETTKQLFEDKSFSINIGA